MKIQKKILKTLPSIEEKHQKRGIIYIKVFSNFLDFHIKKKSLTINVKKCFTKLNK